MNIKFKSTYTTDPKKFKGKIEVDEHFKKLLKDSVKDWKTVTKDNILVEIDEILFNMDHYQFIDESDIGSLDYLEEIEILNPKEVIDSFKYLLKEASCCDSAPCNANYCPTCGEELG